MEIERKYAVNKMVHNLENYKKIKIEQGYLCHNPIVRIRKANEQYILTYKSKIGLKEQPKNHSAIMNHEVELPLTEEAYEVLKSKTEGHMIYKTRYEIPIDHELVAELDVFEKQLKGFIMVEVEFPNEEKAMQFKAPTWFGKELSSDRRFSNYRLSKLDEPPLI